MRRRPVGTEKGVNALSSDWSLARLDAPTEVLAGLRHHYYDAGHMMYMHEADLAQMKADLGDWLTA